MGSNRIKCHLCHYSFYRSDFMEHYWRDHRRTGEKWITVEVTIKCPWCGMEVSDLKTSMHLKTCTAYAASVLAGVDIEGGNET